MNGVGEGESSAQALRNRPPIRSVVPASSGPSGKHSSSSPTDHRLFRSGARGGAADQFAGFGARERGSSLRKRRQRATLVMINRDKNEQRNTRGNKSRCLVLARNVPVESDSRTGRSARRWLTRPKLRPAYRRIANVRGCAGLAGSPKNESAGPLGPISGATRIICPSNTLS